MHTEAEADAARSQSHQVAIVAFHDDGVGEVQALVVVAGIMETDPTKGKLHDAPWRAALATGNVRRCPTPRCTPACFSDT